MNLEELKQRHHQLRVNREQVQQMFHQMTGQMVEVEEMIKRICEPQPQPTINDVPVEQQQEGM